MSTQVEHLVSTNISSLFQYLKNLETTDQRYQLIEPIFQGRLVSCDEAIEVLYLVDTLNSFDPLIQYAIRKMLRRTLEMKGSSNSYLVTDLISACSHIGEYEEVITLSAEWQSLNAQITDREEAGQYCKVLGLVSKAHRNLGQFEEALRCYREILKICDRWDLSLEKAFHMLMIGKMYGNYAGQISLFKFFTERAMSYLESSRFNTKKDNSKALKYTAIAYDTLGQIHRRMKSSVDVVVGWHKRARELHQSLGNKNGMSRAICHECMARFYLERQPSYDEIITLFKQGLDLVARDREHERGFGVRSLQFAELLVWKGNIGDAKQRIHKAKEISRRFRDYKTYVHACLLEAKIEKSNDLEKSYQLLLECQSISKKYSMLTSELETNQMMLEHSARPVASEHSSQVLSRTRDIIQALAVRASSVYNALQSGQFCAADATAIYPEFENLDFQQQTTVMSGVIHDFQWLAEQANGHFHSLALTLERASKRMLDEAGMSLGSELAKIILHDVAHILPAPSGLNHWREVLSSIEASAATIRNNVISDEHIALHAEQILQDVANLSGLSVRFAEIRQRIFSDLAAEKWSVRTVSFRAATKRALDGLIAEGVLSSKDIFLDLQIDITVNFSPVWIERVLENLLRNAMQHALQTKTKEKVCLSITKIYVGDMSVGNAAVMLELCIANLSRKGEEKTLQRALETPGWTSRPDGRGLGVTLANIIFRTALKAETVAFHRSGYTCLCFRFSPDGVKISEGN
jgi:tetratricopeptide (TPR) repeat protein/signal transduction histidine kinase